MKSVLIIGGTGNISTSIVRLLLKKGGYDVTVYNRGLNKRESIPDELRIITGDRNDREKFEKTMHAEHFDYVIDMICFNAEDAKSDLRAFDGRNEQFIMTSTVGAYGKSFDYLPVKEDHPRRPFSAYGRGKAEADDVFNNAYMKNGFPVTILMPSITYGNQLGLVSGIGQNNVWIDRVRKGKPLLISGNGNNLNQFLYVDDAAKGFVGALGKQHCIGEMYWLAHPKYTEWNDYYKAGMKVLGKETQTVCVPLDFLQRLGYPGIRSLYEFFANNLYVDTTKIYRDIPEFRPEISLEEGMSRVIEWCDSEGTVPNSDDYPLDDAIADYMLKSRELKA